MLMQQPSLMPVQSAMYRGPVVPVASFSTPTVAATQLTDVSLLALYHRLMAMPPDGGRSTYHANFKTNFAKLLLYKQIHGTVRVSDKIDAVLASWVRNQRTNLGSFAKGSGPLVGRNNHYDLLCHIGVKPYGQD
jgi:hypothetical protein